jgi:alcohol dehydrogenase
MKAVRYDTFEGPLRLVDVPDPTPTPDGVVVRVGASGLCRSDWHGWQGHDADVKVPHVPGHEFAGTVIETGTDVRKWKQGDRITVPFSMGCGTCERCRAGDEQICDRYYQPGFTGWGSFAEYVALPYADVNLVRLPDAMTFRAAALLGCRFATAYRAVVGQGRTRPGEWVAVHGCGGVGLSATMIAQAQGARVIGVDIARDKLELARSCGAEIVIDAKTTADVAGAIRELTGGGAHVSIDCLGSPATCRKFDPLTPEAGPAHPGGTAPRRSERAARAHESGDRARARNPGDARSAGEGIRRDAGVDHDGTAAPGEAVGKNDYSIAGRP